MDKSTGKPLWRRIRDAVGFVPFVLREYFGRGVPNPFGHSTDDPNVPDGYGQGGKGRNRVFISFERGSAALANEFAKALRSQGIAPYTYTPRPSADGPVLEKSMHTQMEQVEFFQGTSPDSARTLEATLARSHAFIFLLTKRSVVSGVCNVEGFSAFFSATRQQGEAHAFVVLVDPDARMPDLLSKYPSVVYRPGIEGVLAKRIALLLEGN